MSNKEIIYYEFLFDVRTNGLINAVKFAARVILHPKRYPSFFSQQRNYKPENFAPYPYHKRPWWRFL